MEERSRPQVNTLIGFVSDPATDPAEQEKGTVAKNALQTARCRILREELGYFRRLSRLVAALPKHAYGRIEVSFGSAPKNIGAMTERVMKEITRLQDEGPSADLTMRAKEGAKRAYETNLKQNGHWLRRLATVHMLGRIRRRSCVARIESTPSRLSCCAASSGATSRWTAFLS